MPDRARAERRVPLFAFTINDRPTNQISKSKPEAESASNGGRPKPIVIPVSLPTYLPFPGYPARQNKQLRGQQELPWISPMFIFLNYKLAYPEQEWEH